MLELQSRGLGSIPTRGGVIFLFLHFCDTNLHNIARSDRIRFKTKNSNEHCRSNYKEGLNVLCTLTSRVGSEYKWYPSIMEIPASSDSLEVAIVL